MRAVIRYNRDYVSVLCPIGHVLETRKLDATLAGSAFAAELTSYHHGRETRFDRLAASCDGAGHPGVPVRKPAQLEMDL